MNEGWDGRPVNEDESPQDEILVWEIIPHLQNSDYDCLVERSWQKMMSFVRDNLEYLLEQYSEEELQDGVSLSFKLIKMNKNDYDDIVNN